MRKWGGGDVRLELINALTPFLNYHKALCIVFMYINSSVFRWICNERMEHRLYPFLLGHGRVFYFRCFDLRIEKGNS